MSLGHRYSLPVGLSNAITSLQLIQDCYSRPEFLTIASDSMNCPKCQSTQVIKYGHTHYGKPRFRCQDCGRQFVEDATRQPIDQATRQLIDKLLLERLALAAIARVTGVSERWLQLYVNQKFYQTPRTVEVAQKNQVG